MHGTARSTVLQVSAESTHLTSIKQRVKTLYNRNCMSSLPVSHGASAVLDRFWTGHIVFRIAPPPTPVFLPQRLYSSPPLLRSVHSEGS